MIVSPTPSIRAIEVHRSAGTGCPRRAESGAVYPRLPPPRLRLLHNVEDSCLSGTLLYNQRTYVSHFLATLTNHDEVVCRSLQPGPALDSCQCSEVFHRISRTKRKGPPGTEDRGSGRSSRMCVFVIVIATQPVERSQKMQNSIQGSQEVGLAIGLQSCSNPAMPCYPPSQAVGTVLYKGPFNPEIHEKPGEPYQNFTVTIPTAKYFKGKAQLSVDRFHLIGVCL